MDAALSFHAELLTAMFLSVGTVTRVAAGMGNSGTSTAREASLPFAWQHSGALCTVPGGGVIPAAALGTAGL